MGTVSEIRSQRAPNEHPFLYTRARVHDPIWILKFFRFFNVGFFWFVADPHAGEEGTIVRIERGRDSGELVFSILFKEPGGNTVENYFEKDIDFLMT